MSILRGCGGRGLSCSSCGRELIEVLALEKCRKGALEYRAPSTNGGGRVWVILLIVGTSRRPMRGFHSYIEMLDIQVTLTSPDPFGQVSVAGEIPTSSAWNRGNDA